MLAIVVSLYALLVARWSWGAANLQGPQPLVISAHVFSFEQGILRDRERTGDATSPARIGWYAPPLDVAEIDGVIRVIAASCIRLIRGRTCGS